MKTTYYKLWFFLFAVLGCVLAQEYDAFLGLTNYMTDQNAIETLID